MVLALPFGIGALLFYSFPPERNAAFDLATFAENKDLCLGGFELLDCLAARREDVCHLIVMTEAVCLDGFHASATIPDAVVLDDRMRVVSIGSTVPDGMLVNVTEASLFVVGSTMLQTMLPPVPT